MAEGTRLCVFSPEGTLLQQVRPPGAVRLGSLCVTEGHVAVVDEGANVVHVLRRGGGVARQLRRAAMSALHLDEPVDVPAAASGEDGAAPATAADEQGRVEGVEGVGGGDMAGGGDDGDEGADEGAAEEGVLV